MGVKSVVHSVTEHGITYSALVFVCPGCSSVSDRSSGLHLLPVNSKEKTPSWEWDGNLEKPTLSPSILTHDGTGLICHSYLKAGVFEFLNDSTHILSGEHIPIPDLPDWILNED